MFDGIQFGKLLGTMLAPTRARLTKVLGFNCSAAVVLAILRYCLQRLNMPKAFQPALRDGALGFHVLPDRSIVLKTAYGTYNLEPESVNLKPAFDPAVDPHPDIKWKITLNTKITEESLVNDTSSLRRCITDPPFLVGIGIKQEDDTVLSIGEGWRVGDWLFTARHVFEKPGTLAYGVEECVLFKNKVAVSCNVPDLLKTGHYLTPNYVPLSKGDLAAYKLPANNWAVLGVKSLKHNSFKADAEGIVTAYTPSSKGTLVSDGPMETCPAKAKIGLVGHKADTQPGSSGSPLLKHIAGVPYVIGMHIAGDSNVNIGIGFFHLVALMRRVGFYPTVKQGSWWNRLVSPTEETFSSSSSEISSQPFPEDADASDYDSDFVVGALHRRARQNEAVTRHAEQFLDHLGADYSEGAANNPDWCPDGDHNPSRGGGRNRAPREETCKPPRKEHIHAMLSTLLSSSSSHPGGWISREHLMLVSGVAKTRLPSCFTYLLAKVYIELQVRDLSTNAQYVRITEDGARALAQGLTDLQDPQDEVPPPKIDLPPGLSSTSINVPDVPKPDAEDRADQPSPPTETTATVPLPKEETSSRTRRQRARATRSEAATAPPPAPAFTSPVEHSPMRPVTRAGRTRACKLGREDMFDHALVHVLTGKTPPWKNSDWFSQALEPERLQLGDHATGCLSKEQAHAELDKWMTTGSYDALENLAQAQYDHLFEHPGMDEFKRYLRCAQLRPRGAVEFPKLGEDYFLNRNNQLHAVATFSCEKRHEKVTGVKRIDSHYRKILEALGLDGLVGGFVLPPTGTPAIKESLTSQFANLDPGDMQMYRDPETAERLLKFAYKYPASPNFTRRTYCENLEVFAAEADGTRSSGWSSRYKPGNKGAWLTEEGLAGLEYLTKARLALRMACFPIMELLSTSQMIELGLIDPKELFPKPEAHDVPKADAKRWRLIWVSSVVDQALQFLAHFDGNKKDISSYQDGTFSVAGIGCGHHDEGIQRFGQVFDEMFLNLPDGESCIHFSDARHWDLTVCRDVAMASAERRILVTSQGDKLVQRVLYIEQLLSSSNAFALGDKVFVLVHKGVTTSGQYSTSDDNSFERGALLVGAGADAVHSIGDDEAHTGVVDYRKMSSAGVHTKDKVRSARWGDPIEMTSHEFRKQPDGTWTARYLNLNKMLAKLCLTTRPLEKPKNEVLEGIAFCLRHSEDAYRTFWTFCHTLGWDQDPESRAFYGGGAYARPYDWQND